MSGDGGTVDNSVGKTVPGRNGGRLKVGNPGNKGGTGRPPAVIRQRCAETFDRFLVKAEAILKSKTASHGDKLKALDLLGKYGGLQKIENETTVTTNYRDELERERRALGLVS
jgi:hypothetical protein